MFVSKDFINRIIKKYKSQLQTGDLGYIYLDLEVISERAKFSQLLINLGYSVEQILDQVGATVSYMFKGCDTQEEINILNGEMLSKDSFSVCEKIKTIRIGETIKYIEANAFFGCKRLQDIYLPSSLKEINAYAFMNISENSTFHIDMTLDEFRTNVSMPRLPFNKTVLIFKDGNIVEVDPSKQTTI